MLTKVSYPPVTPRVTTNRRKDYDMGRERERWPRSGSGSPQCARTSRQFDHHLNVVTGPDDHHRKVTSDVTTHTPAESTSDEQPVTGGPVTQSSTLLIMMGPSMSTCGHRQTKSIASTYQMVTKYSTLLIRLQFHFGSHPFCVL